MLVTQQNVIPLLDNVIIPEDLILMIINVQLGFVTHPQAISLTRTKLVMLSTVIVLFVIGKLVTAIILEILVLMLIFKIKLPVVQLFLVLSNLVEEMINVFLIFVMHRKHQHLNVTKHQLHLPRIINAVFIPVRIAFSHTPM